MMVQTGELSSAAPRLPQECRLLTTQRKAFDKINIWAGDLGQWFQRLSRKCKVPGLISSNQKSFLVVFLGMSRLGPNTVEGRAWRCTPVIPALREAEAGGSK